MILLELWLFKTHYIMILFAPLILFLSFLELIIIIFAECTTWIDNLLEHLKVPGVLGMFPQRPDWTLVVID